MIRALVIGAAVSVVVVVVAVATPFEPSAAVPAADGAATGDVAKGATLFAASCAGCHGAAGTGGTGPDITQVAAPVALAKIAAGGGVMPAGLATGQDAADIAAFVDSLDAAAPAPAATTEAPATTAAAATTTEAPSPDEALTAISELKRALRRGQSQVNVLLEHTTFLEKALAERNFANIHFHAEHLANIVTGEPIRDLDGNGEPSNPGDGIGLSAYTSDAGRAYTDLGNAPLVSDVDRDRAEAALVHVDFILGRLRGIVNSAERVAVVGTVDAARQEIIGVRGSVNDVAASYRVLRRDFADFEVVSS